MAVSLILATTTGTAARLDPATLIDAARFRAEFGFAADPAVIQAAESDQNANWDWGVALLPAEAAEMARRDAIEDRLGPLNRYLAARPGFGGAYRLTLASPALLASSPMSTPSSCISGQGPTGWRSATPEERSIGPVP